MRLTCPECAAQYEIADGLIPPEGRDVECSACGHGWRQLGAPTLVLTPEAAIEEGHPAAAADLPPPAARGLSDPVLSILREEAERELAARAAEREARRDPLAADIAEATRRGPAPQRAAAEDALPDPHALAASLRWEVPGRPEAEVIPPPDREPAPAAPARAPARTGTARVALRQRRAHDRGFAVAMLLTLLLLGAYAAAPALADRGAAGARLMQARAAADEGRVWLQARAEALTDGAIEGVAGLFE